MRRMLMCLLIVGCAVCSQGCKKKPGEQAKGDEIVIGEYGSSTGATATFGQSAHEGIMLAIDQINSAGGVLGKKIRIIFEDDESNADKAVAAAQKLVNRDNVVAVLGEVASKRSLAGGQVCEKAKVPMLSPASTNPQVTKGEKPGTVKEWVFRACFTDDFQGAVNGRFAAEHGWKKVAVLTNVDEDYSKGLANSFKETFKKVAEPVADESYRGQDKDFKAQLTRIKAANPDAVFLPGYYTEVGLILRQAREEVGLTCPFFGGDGWDSPETLKLGAVANGCFYSDHYSPDDPRPEVKLFLDAYKAKYGRVPDAMAVLGYDAARVMADAIKRAGKVDSAAIRDALATTKDFPGASGAITIDENHNARKPIVILEIQNNATKLVKTINPE
ncbi:MAG TPA: ABC transporter substrate-binding protein [Tepidisphaeraceae bacterium]